MTWRPRQDTTSIGLTVRQVAEQRSRIGPPAGLHQRDFRLIARAGFGDGQNAYAHSMAWFNDSLYVGTTRGNFPLMRARLPIGMDVWPVECPENPFDLDLRSEIWRYDVQKDTWRRVYKAPLIKGSHGKLIPRDLGYRGMIVYREPNEAPRLFVSTWSPAKGPGPLLLMTMDGEDFVPSCEPGLMGLPVTTIRALATHKGRLFTTPAGSRGGNPNVSGHSVVYESTYPSSGRWEPVSDFGFGDAGNLTIFEMESFGEHLYVGTLNLSGYQVWRSTLEGQKPYIWEKVIDRGAHRGPLNQIALSMAVFKGALYVGSAIQGGGIDRQNRVGPAPPELIRIYPDGEWELIVGDSRDTPSGYKHALSGYLPGMDNLFNGYFWRMVEHQGWLYLSTFEWSSVLGYANRRTWPQAFVNIVNSVGPECILERQSGFELYRSYDGENWVPVTTNGMGNPFNIGLRTLASTEHGLFVGTTNPFGPNYIPLGEQTYRHNPRGGCEVFLGT